MQIPDLSANLHEFSLGEPPGNSWIRFWLAYDDDVIRFHVVPGDIRGTLGKDIRLPGCQKLRKLEYRVRRPEIDVVAVLVQWARLGKLSHRRPSEEDRRRGVEMRGFRRPDRRIAHRQGHPINLARTRMRGRTAGWELRLGL